MRTLDYLRKAVPSVKETLVNFADDPEYVAHARDVLQAAQRAVKFVLPENGRIFDTDFRGLPDVIRLPYQFLIVEYEATATSGLVDEVYGVENTRVARKRIVYAEQMEDSIMVASIIAFNEDGVDNWQVQPYFCEVISKSVLNDPVEHDDWGKINELEFYKTLDQIVMRFHDMGHVARDQFGDDWERRAYCDMNDESSAVLSLIEALACRNVGMEKLGTRKINKSAAKRGALPFDDYYILMINGSSRSTEVKDGTHRSPREHLRRGHIRRLPGGNVWVNSTVVNAGTQGKIHKQYALAA